MKVLARRPLHQGGRARRERLIVESRHDDVRVLRETVRPRIHYFGQCGHDAKIHVRWRQLLDDGTSDC